MLGRARDVTKKGEGGGGKKEGHPVKVHLSVSTNLVIRCGVGGFGGKRRRGASSTMPAFSFLPPFPFREKKKKGEAMRYRNASMLVI